LFLSLSLSPHIPTTTIVERPSEIVGNHLKPGRGLLPETELISILLHLISGKRPRSNWLVSWSWIFQPLEI
jgi:hypothetical protein